jgi:hypothetical protein
MPLIPVFKGYLLDKGSSMRLKGEEIIELKLITHQDHKLVVNVVDIETLYNEPFFALRERDLIWAFRGNNAISSS